MNQPIARAFENKSELWNLIETADAKIRRSMPTTRKYDSAEKQIETGAAGMAREGHEVDGRAFERKSIDRTEQR